LKKIEIRGLKSSLKSNVIVAIAELALSLKRFYGQPIAPARNHSSKANTSVSMAAQTILNTVQTNTSINANN